MTWYWQL